jgi:hypothetical protein
LTSVLLITSPNFTFPITDEAAFTAAIKAGILAGQVAPLAGLEGAPITGGDLQSNSTEYGSNIPAGIAAPSFDYDYRRGGVCLEEALMALNGKQRRIVWIDKNNFAWGEAVSETQGRGFLGTVMAHPTFATANTAPFIKRFNVAHEDAFWTAWASKFAMPVNDPFDGLIGVVLQQTATAGEMRIVSTCGGQDFGALWADEWKEGAFLDASGQNPTAATVDPDTGILTIAPTAGSYRVAPASVLDGLDIIGLDGLNTLVSAAAKA